MAVAKRSDDKKLKIGIVLNDTRESSDELRHYSEHVAEALNLASLARTTVESLIGVDSTAMTKEIAALKNALAPTVKVYEQAFDQAALMGTSLNKMVVEIEDSVIFARSEEFRRVYDGLPGMLQAISPIINEFQAGLEKIGATALAFSSQYLQAQAQVQSAASIIGQQALAAMNESALIAEGLRARNSVFESMTAVSIDNSIIGRFAAIDKAYSDRFAHFHADLTTRTETTELLSPPIIRRIGEEYRRHAEFPQVLHRDNESILAPSSVFCETIDEVEACVRDIDDSFVKALRGARNTLRSGNPDEFRHYCSSMRELFKKIMFKLAPDDKVRVWETKRGNSNIKKISMRHRLYYLCRDVCTESLVEVIECDIDSYLKWYGLLSDGVHEFTIEPNATQFIIVQNRAEEILRFIFTVSGKIGDKYN